MSIEILKNMKTTRYKMLKKQKSKDQHLFFTFIPHLMHQPDSLVVFTPFYHFATCHVLFMVYWQTDSQRKEGFVYRQF